VPALRCEVLIVLVILLPLTRAKRLDFVYRSSPGEEISIGFAETRVTARFFVDLDFEPCVHGDKLGDQRPAKPGEAATTDHLPVRGLSRSHPRIYVAESPQASQDRGSSQSPVHS
jgi:hypothetical protein